MDHRFRHGYHGRAWWLGSRGSWVGKRWDPRSTANADAVDELLGRLQGRIEDNRITLSGRHTVAFHLRFTGEEVDLDRPLVIRIEGRPEQTIELVPDLGLALREATASFDLDRIWWAGWESDSPP